MTRDAPLADYSPSYPNKIFSCLFEIFFMLFLLFRFIAILTGSDRMNFKVDRFCALFNDSRYFEEAEPASCFKDSHEQVI